MPNAEGRPRCGYASAGSSRPGRLLSAIGAHAGFSDATPQSRERATERSRTGWSCGRRWPAEHALCWAVRSMSCAGCQRHGLMPQRPSNSPTYVMQQRTRTVGPFRALGTRSDFDP